MATSKRSNPSNTTISRGESEERVREIVMRQEAHFSGPLPPPAILQGYNEVIPGGAERILAMAERQSAHREALERAVVQGNVAVQSRGNHYAFIIAMTAILGGIFLIHEGKDTGGLVSIISAMSGIAGVFIYSKYEQARERKAKSEALPKPRKRS